MSIVSPGPDGDTPVTPPSPQPEPLPPVLAMTQAAAPIADATQTILEQIYACINAAGEAIDQSEWQVRMSLHQCLHSIEQVYDGLSDAVSTDILARVGYVQTLIDSLPFSAITDGELAQRAGAIGWPAGPLPPLPQLPQRYVPTVTPRVQEVAMHGTALGVPNNPGPPSSLLSLYPSMPAASGGASQGGAGRPAGSNPQGATTVTGFRAGGGISTTPQNQPTTPYTPSGTTGNVSVTPSSGATPGATPGATAGQTGYAPFGSGPAAPAPLPQPNWGQPAQRSPGPLPQLLTSQPAASQPAAQTAGAAPGGCPPVNITVPVPSVTVNVNCQPGAGGSDTATASAQGGSATVNIGPQQYIGTPTPTKTYPPDYIPGTTDNPDVPIKPATVPPGPRPGGTGTGKIVDNAQTLVGKLVENVLSQLVTPRGCESLQSLDAESGKWVQELVKSIWATTPSGKADPASAVGAAVAATQDWIQPTLTAIVDTIAFAINEGWGVATQLVGCDRPLYPAMQAARALLGVIEHWAGVPFPEGNERIDQTIGQLCPVRIPSADEADWMRTLGLITPSFWTCLVRANGIRDDLHETVWNAKLPRANPDQMIAYARRLGGDQSAANSLMAEVGMIEPRSVQALWELSNYVPGPSDLIRFLVRDVFDPSVVTKYGFDEEFEAKWQGQALRWGYAQGMSVDTARYYWRAHWQLPSPSQGYTMIHRLRPGAVDASVVTTQDDILKLLEIDDYPPYWRNRLVAISYHPLTRIDTRRAYFLGTLSVEETTSAIMDLGYTADNAAKLLKYWSYDRINWLVNQPLVRSYVRGEVTDTELDDWIAGLNLAGEQYQQFMSRLGILSDVPIRRNILRAIRKRVVMGMTDWTEAQTELIAMGYRAARAGDLAQSWDDERKARGRFASASQLCQMYAAGIVDVVTYSSALLRLGYDAVDVQRIMALGCDRKGTGAVPLPGGEQRGGQALPGPQGPASKKAQSAAKAELMRQVRARNNLAKSEEGVQKKLTQTMGKLARAFGGMPQTYQSKVRGLFDTLTKEKCYTRPGAAGLVYELLVDLAARHRTDWLAIAEEYVDGMDPRPCPAPDQSGRGEALAEPEG